MYKKAQDVLHQLPPEYKVDLLPEIRNEFLKDEETVVVFDDDPTGTQTCHDVVVLMSWAIDLLAAELNKKPSILFILTNSRSLPQAKAIQLNIEIGANLAAAVERTGRKVVVINRSDSTLRGHFPAEVEAIVHAMHLRDAVWILIPAFIEGGRYTIDDIHYIIEQGDLVPVSDTPFAKDRSFGYTHANLKKWVEEKSGGRIKSSDVLSCSIQEIRQGGPDVIADKLLMCIPGTVVIVNATSYRDLEVLAMAILKTKNSGKRFIYRSSATFVSIRAGIGPGKIFTPAKDDMDSTNGSLVVVGSYVPKTTHQLRYLLERRKHEVLEVNVHDLWNAEHVDDTREHMVRQTERWLSSGKDVVIYTSRELKAGADAESSLKINSVVSTFLVSIVNALRVRPAFIIAKGGITSSDLASQGLSSKSAVILGQAIAGVPVWRLDSTSKFPKMIYVVFPGNVGDEAALWNVWNKFKSPA